VPLKADEIIKPIEADGCYLLAARRSHRQFKHPDKPVRLPRLTDRADGLSGYMLQAFSRRSSRRCPSIGRSGPRTARPLAVLNGNPHEQMICNPDQQQLLNPRATHTRHRSARISPVTTT